MVSETPYVFHMGHIWNPGGLTLLKQDGFFGYATTLPESPSHVIDVCTNVNSELLSFTYLLPRRAQWRRQRSKGARSFQGQKIIQSGHPDALFSSNKSMPFV